MLPADLLFSVTTNHTGFDQNTLVRLDATTLKMSVFYTDPTFDWVYPISWSPRGDLLIIIRSKTQNDTFQREYCVLNRSGLLQGCLKEPPIGGPYEELYGGDNLVVTWSLDEKSVYYLTGLGKGDERNLRLIQADVATGQQTRILYRYSVSDAEIASRSNSPEPLISWTTSLDTLILGTGDLHRIEDKTPIIEVDLQNGQQQNLLVTRPVAGQSTPQPYLILAGFSPQNNYMLALLGADIRVSDQFLILDKRQQIVRSFSLPPTQPEEIVEYGFLNQPGWLPDEQGLYIGAISLRVLNGEQVKTIHFFKYTLSDKQLIEVFRTPFPSDEYPYSNRYNGMARLKVSPSGTHVAYDETFLNLNGEEANHWEIVVVSEKDGMLRFRDS